jgi:hypothetical protein
MVQHKVMHPHPQPNHHQQQQQQRMRRVMMEVLAAAVAKKRTMTTQLVAKQQIRNPSGVGHTSVKTVQLS